MRNYFSATILSLLSITAFSQTTLTQQNNALKIGESSKYNEIQYLEAGAAGLNQVWDFSEIKSTEKSPITSYQPALANQPEGIVGANLSILDDGYNYLMNSNENFLEELGYVNLEKNMNMVYSNPVLKMRYPFTYGETFTDPFAGVAFFNNSFKIEFNGEYTATADAYGTLILPHLILQNVMRVKTVKSGLQVNPCGQIKVTIVKYAWYAPGYRYPVLVTNSVENLYYNGLNPDVKNTAFVAVFPTIISDDLDTKSVINNVNTSNATLESVNLFPNPFNDKINYNYVLKSDMPVSITMYDITGKYNEQIANKEIQTAGFHSGEISGANRNLAAGVYYLRFIFGDQVVVQKFVKLEAE